MPNASSFKYVTVCGEDCVGEDLFSIWAYSLEACVQACRNMQYVHSTDKVCKAIALRADMQNVGILGGNCYLKTGCSEPIAQPVKIAHAVLL
jgi:dissimilatory sulfite reductase (desulfoviridin) alpha/beta subunit